MKKGTTADLAAQICGLLSPLEAQERTQILQAVQILLGVTVVTPQPPINQNKTGVLGVTGSGNAKQFFDTKDPQNKGENFAVAAKFAIESGQGETHTLDSLRNIIKVQAKRHFDASNFVRDMANAISNAKLFMWGDNKGEYVLSADGEKYVDALPDRAAAKATKKSAKKTKKVKKKKAA